MKLWEAREGRRFRRVTWCVSDGAHEGVRKSTQVIMHHVSVWRLVCLFFYCHFSQLHCSSFCREPIRNEWVQDAWNGLTKPTHDCRGKTQECLRSDWTWVDDTPYDYSTFHDWVGNNEPDENEHCARFKKSGWLGRGCDARFGYICEKATTNTVSFQRCE